MVGADSEREVSHIFGEMVPYINVHALFIDSHLLDFFGEFNSQNIIYDVRIVSWSLIYHLRTQVPRISSHRLLLTHNYKPQSIYMLITFF